jgi:O-methyltransferase
MSGKRTWIVDLFHWRGDPPVRAKLGELAHEMGKTPYRTGNFAGDNLVTIERNLSFLDDAAFLNAFHRAQPNRVEQSCIWRTATLYWAAGSGLRVPGDFVEAACYRGFSARVLYDALGLKDTTRSYWLYDLFEPTEEVTGRLAAHSDTLFEEVKARFADAPRVQVTKGRVPDSFVQAAPEKVAFLHLDMNNAGSEIGALEFLWERISPGAVIIFDDYGWLGYREQKLAIDAWLAQHNVRVLELPSGQGMALKL